ncbi:MAG: hypothetical protein HY000_20290 [Planctomycetes bacterium]|nr:hypothetical protein [Planctomycetota bacterium]
MLSLDTRKAGVALRLVLMFGVAATWLGCGRTSQAPDKAPATGLRGDGNLQYVLPGSNASLGKASDEESVAGAALSSTAGISREAIVADESSPLDRRIESTQNGPALVAPKPPTDEQAPAEEPEDLARRPLFHDWPKPAAVIVFTGQQHGYLEPCGCAPLLQIGGLARRYGFIESLRKKQWPLLLVDLGGLLEDNIEPVGPDKFIISPEQSEAKFEISLEALKQMGYSDLNLGPEDLSVPRGLNGVAGWLINIAQPRAINANLGIDDEFVELGLFQPYVVRKIGPFKIGITGVIGDKHKENIADPAIHEKLTPKEALPDVLAKMKKESDLHVLMLYGYVDEAKELAKKFPDLDVIIHADRVDEPPGHAEQAEQVDKKVKTVLVTVGTKGKYAGALGIFRNGEEQPQIRFQLVRLDKRFPETKEIRKLLDEEYLQKLEHLNLVEKTPKRPFDPARPGQTFVGSEKCGQCHPNAYENWNKTDHAHALKTLVLGHARNKPQHQAGGKQVNPECVVCHTTGFNYTSGYDGTKKTAHLGGNGCENCHGAGSEHVAIYSNLKAKPEELTLARKLMHVKPQLSEQICKRCHDGENDPTFVFEKRWFESDPPVEHGDAAEKDRKLWPSIREKLAN